MSSFTHLNPVFLKITSDFLDRFKRSMTSLRVQRDFSFSCRRVSQLNVRNTNLISWLPSRSSWCVWCWVGTITWNRTHINPCHQHNWKRWGDIYYKSSPELSYFVRPTRMIHTVCWASSWNIPNGFWAACCKLCLFFKLSGHGTALVLLTTLSKASIPLYQLWIVSIQQKNCSRLRPNEINKVTI